MWIVRAVLVLLLILLAVAFAFNNNGPDQKVAVNLEPLFANRVDVPLITVVFWSFVGGAVLSALLFVSIYLKQVIQTRFGRKRIRALESEVMILRNRPIEESAELLKGADQKKSELDSPFADK
jgi:uncharacterized integral membrane protein